MTSSPSAESSGGEAEGGRAARVKMGIFLLWLISRKPAHGYDILKTIKSDPMMGKVAASRIYPILRGLKSLGLVSQKTVKQGRRAKKLYAVTAKGRRTLDKAKAFLRSSKLMAGFMEDMLG